MKVFKSESGYINIQPIIETNTGLTMRYGMTTIAVLLLIGKNLIYSEMVKYYLSMS